MSLVAPNLLGGSCSPPSPLVRTPMFPITNYIHTVLLKLKRLMLQNFCTMNSNIINTGDQITYLTPCQLKVYFVHQAQDQKQ